MYVCMYVCMYANKHYGPRHLSSKHMPVHLSLFRMT